MVTKQINQPNMKRLAEVLQRIARVRSAKALRLGNEKSRSYEFSQKSQTLLS